MSAVERVLVNRGIELSDVEHYLNTSEDDILDPKRILNIQEGAKMLVKHIQADHNIFI